MWALNCLVHWCEQPFLSEMLYAHAGRTSCESATDHGRCESAVWEKKGEQFCLLQSAPEITTAALDGSDPLAAECVDLFLEIIGAEAGNCALKFMARGGVYLCGGILPRVTYLPTCSLHGTLALGI